VARAEGRPADIDGVGAVADRLDADVGVLGGGEQFDATGHGRGVENSALVGR